MNLIENRIETFFNLEQSDDNAITILALPGGDFISKKNTDNFYVYENKKYECEAEPKIHWQLCIYLRDKHHRSWYGNEMCRLWLPSKLNKYSVFAIEDIKNYKNLSNSIKNVFKFYNINMNDFIYFDMAFEKNDVEPEDTLIKVENIFKINEELLILYDMLKNNKQEEICL